MNIDEIKDELIKYGKFIFNKNLSAGTSGNISARWDDGCLITASGSCFGTLTRDDIVLINAKGEVVNGSKKPSSEKNLHLAIYKKRTEMNSICHCHCPYATAFAVAGREIDKPILPELVYYFGKIPLAKYAPPGSDELVSNTICHFEKATAVLMQNHGLITVAKDIPTSFFYTDLIEANAKIYILAKQLGHIGLIR